MEPLSHLFGLAIVAAILASVGGGLAFLNAVAIRVPLRPRPPFWRLLPVLVPGGLWAGFSVYLLSLMAMDPGAANLWPLTIGLLAIAWLAWIAVSALGALLLRWAT